MSGLTLGMKGAMGACPPSLQQFLARVAAEIRVRRAERGAWRGAFWGAVAAVAILATRGWGVWAADAWDWAPAWAGSAALTLAVLAVAIGAAAGAARGASRRIHTLASARLADRAYGLQDRISTALEWSIAPPPDRLGPLAEAQLADTVTRVGQLAGRDRRRIVPRSLPREARMLPAPLALMAALVLLPPLPEPATLMQAVPMGKAKDERAVSLLERIKLLGSDLLQRQPPVAPEAQRGREEAQPTPNEAAEFKDKAISRRDANSDFSSFAKKGDERLRLLDRADKLPDLQSDFASSQYRSMARKAQELASAKGGKLSDAKMGQILREMEKLGRKENGGGEWGDDVSNAMQALEDGDSDQAMQGLQQALGKLRDAEDKQRASRALQGGRDDRPGQPDSGRGESGDLSRQGPDMPGYGEGKSGNSPGSPTARLRSTPYDAAISGSRRGRAPSADTQMSSRPGAFGQQLQYRGEIGQYRRQMEDAIAREQIPRDYHNQIRDYFKSLQEQ